MSSEEVDLVEAAIQAEMDRDFRAWEETYAYCPWGLDPQAPDPPDKVWHTSPRRVAIAAIRALDEARTGR